MKRFLFLAAFCAYFLTACTSSETAPPAEETPTVNVDTTATAPANPTGAKTDQSVPKGGGSGKGTTTTNQNTTSTPSNVTPPATHEPNQSDRTGTETGNSVTNRGGTEIGNSVTNRGGAKKIN